MKTLPPAPKPCESCPYRRDVPSGVWAASEYNKLPEYDLPTPFQPTGVFMCHQGNDRLCAGWCATHDMPHTLAMRVALSMGTLSRDVFLAVMGYKTTVPVFATGAEAAEHGRRDVAKPRAAACKMAAKLMPRILKGKNR
jgi:hypothetical protein